MIRKSINKISSMVLLSVLGTSFAFIPTATAATVSVCSALNDDVHRVINPSSQASLLTTSTSEVTSSAAYGFTTKSGVLFDASTTSLTGLVPVYRLYNAATDDFMVSSSASERTSAVANHGYKVQKIEFYASPVQSGTCTIPAYRYIKGDKHRIVISSTERTALTNAGWKSEGIKFWVAKNSTLTATTPTTTAPTTTAPAPTNPISATGSRDVSVYPFSAKSPWNTAIGSGVKFETATGTRTRSFLSATPVINRDPWSISLRQATAADPIAKLESTRTGKTYQIRIPTNLVMTGGTDRHATVIQPDGVTSYDIYKMEKVSNTHWRAAVVNVTDLRGTGINAGVRAAATPGIAGLIRAEELRNKSISHALAASVPDNALKNGYVWPAARQDSDGATAYSGGLPMGSLLALPSSVNIDSLGLSAEGKALAKALQNYGAYVVDRSGTTALYCERNCDSAATLRMNADWKKLHPLMRAVTNNTSTTVGGGGTPRVATMSNVMN